MDDIDMKGLDSHSVLWNREADLFIPKEYVCGGVASMINIVLVFPIHKTVFFQQLEGVPWSVAFSRLRHEGLNHMYRGVLPPLLQRATTTSIMFGFKSQCQRSLDQFRLTERLSPVSKTVISASMAGALEALLTPFERVQTLLQSSNSSQLYKNTSHALSSLYRFHGFSELYRGFTAIIARNCIGNILYFSGKEWLYDKTHSVDQPFSTRLFMDFMIGGFLGSVIGAIIFPFNVVKAQMQANVGTEFSSVRVVLNNLLSERQHSKVARLYSGLPVNFARSMLSWGVITMVYEGLLAL